MIKKVDHIGIMVKDLESAIAFFKDTYGLSATSRSIIGDTQVAFLPISNIQIELIQFGLDHSSLAKYIGEKAEGIHHIAFEVEDLLCDLEKIKSYGVACIDKVPRKGAHGSMVAFLHPKSNCGVLIELVQHKKE